MTKCQQAQEGIDGLLDSLDKLLEQANVPEGRVHTGENARKSVSIQIRMILVQIMRCIIHYSNHIAGFKAEVAPMERISYCEDQLNIILTDEESLRDLDQQEEELECLGSIGFTNSKEPY